MSTTKIEFPNSLEFQDHQEKWAFPAKKAVLFRPKMAPFRPQNAPFLRKNRAKKTKIRSESRQFPAPFGPFGVLAPAYSIFRPLGFRTRFAFAQKPAQHLFSPGDEVAA